MHLHPHLQLLADEHGTFLRREAIALGHTDRDLARARRQGLLVRVRYGAYAFGETWTTLDDVERNAVRTRAVIRASPGVLAASHHSACALHGMDLWSVPLALAHVTRLDGGAGRRESDVIHHEGLCLDGDITMAGGVPATVPVRAALESALLTDVERGLVVADAGLRHGLFTREELHEQHELMRAWPAARHLTLVTRLADERSESVGETRMRHLMWWRKIPAPQLQFEVWAGRRLVGRTDFAWPELRLLGEFDGLVKYGRFRRPGETVADAVVREKLREDELREVTGWRMIRFTWADLAEPDRTAARVRALMKAA